MKKLVAVSHIMWAHVGGSKRLGESAGAPFPLDRDRAWPC